MEMHPQKYHNHKVLNILTRLHSTLNINHILHSLVNLHITLFQLQTQLTYMIFNPTGMIYGVNYDRSRTDVKPKEIEQCQELRL